MCLTSILFLFPLIDNLFLIFPLGSAGGLGKAFAEKLLDRGALVCISDIKVRTVTGVYIVHFAHYPPPPHL